jgi:hypothetical protein
MRKQIQGVIKKVIRQSLIGYSKSVLGTILTIVFALLVARNVIASQEVPALYYRLYDDNPRVMAEFLRKIRLLPEYGYFEERAVNLYGEDIRDEVNREAIQRELTIGNLEEMLTRNPKSRDVLVALAILHKADNNREKYQEYRARALAVDPAVAVE